MGILERFLNKPPTPKPVPEQGIDEPVHVPVQPPDIDPQPQALVPAQTPVKPVHSQPPGKYTGTRMPLEKVLDILRLYDDGHSPTAISETVHSDTRTIGAVLRQYRDRPQSAKQLLTQAAVMAAQAWQQAVPIAAARGNHGPAKELLLHVGAIEPAYGPGAARPTNVAVQVVIGTPDQPIPFDPVNPKPIK